MSRGTGGIPTEDEAVIAATGRGKTVRLTAAQAVAASFGAHTWRVATTGELRQALHEARAESGSCVIVAEVEPQRDLPGKGMWWDIPIAETSDDHAKTRGPRPARQESSAFPLLIRQDGARGHLPAARRPLTFDSHSI